MGTLGDVTNVLHLKDIRAADLHDLLMNLSSNQQLLKCIADITAGWLNGWIPLDVCDDRFNKVISSENVPKVIPSTGLLIRDTKPFSTARARLLGFWVEESDILLCLSGAGCHT